MQYAEFLANYFYPMRQFESTILRYIHKALELDNKCSTSSTINVKEDYLKEFFSDLSEAEILNYSKAVSEFF